MKIKFLLLISIFGLLLINPETANSQSTFGINDGPGEELVELSVAFSSSQAAAGQSYHGALIVDIKTGWHINSAHPIQDYLIPTELTFDTVSGLTPYSITYPKASELFLLGETMSLYDDKVIIFFKVDIAENLSIDETNLPLQFTYQACNNKECRAPQTEDLNLSIKIGNDGNSTHESIFAKLTEESSEVFSTTIPEQKSDIEKLVEEHGTWGYVLALGLAFITGLLLSFSPCTYPMVPITVSIFAGQKRSVGRGFVLSLFYVGTMAVVYGIMGLIVSMVGGVFGAWLASTPVVIGIAVVFVIFSLSMFGLYNLDVPMALRNKLGTAKTGGGVTGAIVLGVIAALVISPCVGPFVAGILLYIATFGSPVFGFLVLFVFAIGLGTLYILIGTFSSTISSLPGAGEWMESVKKFFGFVLLFMALYFLNNILPESLIYGLGGLLLLILAVFGGGFDRLTPDSGLFPRLKKLIGLIAFILAIYLLLGTLFREGVILPEKYSWLGFSDNTRVEKKLIDWDIDLDKGLNEAKAESKPVLIDTWATWCANCRVLDKKVFGNQDVAKQAKRFKALKIQLEKSNSPETKAFMKRFGLKLYSLPTILLLDSKGNVAEIIQGVLEPEEMIVKMNRVH